MSLATAVEQAISALDLSEADKAAAELATAYATRIDDGADLDKTGPLLFTVLEALLMTPRARAAVLKGGNRDGSTRNPLDELRERRAARQRDAAVVDTAAT